MTKKYFRGISILSTILLVLYSAINVAGQSILTETYIDKCPECQPEKVYVHLAQNNISAGEELNFKVYLVSTDKQLNVKSSSVVYLDIIDEFGQKQASWRSNINNGVASCRAIVPDTIATGVYMLRSYTRWMMNFNNDYVFQTPVFILNLADDTKRSVSKVAYSATSKNLKKQNNIETTIKLDALVRNDTLIVLADSVDNENLWLLAVSHGRTLFEKKIDLGVSPFIIDKLLTDSNIGIINLFVCSDKGMIYTESSVQYNPTPPIQLSLNKLERSYKPGDKIRFEIIPVSKTKNSKFKLSCSVSEYNKLGFLPECQSISDYFYFYSEFSATAWYNSHFNSKQCDTAKQLFCWNNSIWSENYKVKGRNVKESGACLLSGRVTDKLTGKPIVNKNIVLSIEGELPYLNYSTTNASGEFFFWLKPMLDNSDLILQIFDANLNNSEIDWQIFNDVPSVKNLNAVETELTNIEKQTIAQSKQLSLINRIYFPLVPPVNENIPINFSSLTYAPNYTIFPADYEQLANFQEISSNILPGITLKKKRSGIELDVYDPEERVLLDSGCIVLLNGVLFNNLDYISKLPIGVIERIDIYQSDFLLGDLNFRGIVAIYTKDKSLPAEYITNSAYIVKNLVLPADNNIIYASATSVDNAPNLKSLLFWDPNINLENEPIIIEFPASDYKGRFEVIIEGVSDEGKPVSARQLFTIE